MLRNEELDLFIGALTDSDRHEFAQLAVTADDMVVGASATHRLAGRRVSVEELVNENWLIPDPLQ